MEEEKKKDWWFIGITAFSIFYFIAAWFILAMNLWYSPPSPELGLNGIGDYLAGALTPLAFGWLIYGHLQQNKIHNYQVKTDRLEKFNDAQPEIKVNSLTIENKEIEGYEKEIKVLTIEFTVQINSIFNFSFYPINSENFDAPCSGTIPTIIAGETKTLDILLVSEGFEPLEAIDYDSITHFLFKIPALFSDKNSCPIETHLNVFIKSDGKYWGSFKTTRKSIN
jgi:hypothetical protein